MGRIAVEWVPEGMTADEARRNRASQRELMRTNWLGLIGAIIGLLAIIGIIVAVVWWFFFRVDEPARADELTTEYDVPAEMQQDLPAIAPVVITATHTPSPEHIQPPTQTATATPKNTVVALPTNTPAVLTPAFVSPVVTPAIVVITPTQAITPVVITVATDTVTTTISITPTATPLPLWQVIYQQRHAEPNAGAGTHVSGWVVNADGSARAEEVQLCHQNGCMRWPRPGMTDVANGYYEFLASPGHYTLRVGSLDHYLVIDADSAARYEISVQYNGDEPAPARVTSANWGAEIPNAPAEPGSTATPTATATPVPVLIYLPLIAKNHSAPIASPTATPTSTPTPIDGDGPAPTATQGTGQLPTPTPTGPDDDPSPTPGPTPTATSTAPENHTCGIVSNYSGEYSLVKNCQMSQGFVTMAPAPWMAGMIAELAENGRQCVVDGPDVVCTVRVEDGVLDNLTVGQHPVEISIEQITLQTDTISVISQILEHQGNVNGPTNTTTGERLDNGRTD